MSEIRKKIIPKFQKKLSGFLSDEAGKISKEDVLKMGIIAMGIVGIYSIDQMNAGHWNADNYQTIHAPSNSHVNQGYGCSVSEIRNGHISMLASTNCVGWVSADHGNHANHGSHGSCCGGSW